MYGPFCQDWATEVAAEDTSDDGSHAGPEQRRKQKKSPPTGTLPVQSSGIPAAVHKPLMPVSRLRSMTAPEVPSSAGSAAAEMLRSGGHTRAFVTVAASKAWRLFEQLVAEVRCHALRMLLPVAGDRDWAAIRCRRNSPKRGVEAIPRLGPPGDAMYLHRKAWKLFTAGMQIPGGSDVEQWRQGLLYRSARDCGQSAYTQLNLPCICVSFVARAVQ